MSRVTVNSMDVGHWMVSVCAKAMEARTFDGKCRGTTVNSMDVEHWMVSVCAKAMEARTFDGKC